MREGAGLGELASEKSLRAGGGRGKRVQIAGFASEENLRA